MKKIILLTTAAVVALPLAASAETINLYGWQNHSYELVDLSRPAYQCSDPDPMVCLTQNDDGSFEPLLRTDGGREFSRIQANAANIGFSASVETGIGDMRVNLQCEQFTYVNHYAGGTGWCNRNSKIGLSSASLGEIMFATWLLPYNEAVAQWVDPFYDAGADSHTSIMGSIGGRTIFYNTGQFEASSSGGSGEFNYGAADFDQGFNRRQENIIQYWSPNINGFVFRFAMTAGNRDETTITTDFNTNGVLGDSFTNAGGTFSDESGEIDPRIYSTSLAYENGPLWLAATYQKHEDWAAAGLTTTTGGPTISMPERPSVTAPVMTGSEADSYRLAARYIFDLGEGKSVQLAAMYEDLEYEFKGTIGHRSALIAFGFAHAEGHDQRSDERWASHGIGPLQTQTDDDGTERQVYSLEAYMGRGNMTMERSAWMVSGKVKFGGPVDFRFSYMDADDIDLRCGNHPLDADFPGACPDTWVDSGADAWNIGLFYTMPAGTELRMTYSEVNNDFNATYGQGISGTGLGAWDSEIEMFALGIVHWFD